MKSSSSGFTLIELMVVIALIAFLASAVSLSLSKVRASADDTSREETIHQLSKAAYLYSLDNASLPSATGGNAASLCTAANTVMATLVANNYLSSLPKNDPTDPYCIRMKSDGTTMAIFTPYKAQTYTGLTANKQTGALVGNTTDALTIALCQGIFAGGAQGYPIRNPNTTGAGACSGSTVADKVLGATAGTTCRPAYDALTGCSSVCVTSAQVAAGGGRYYSTNSTGCLTKSGVFPMLPW